MDLYQAGHIEEAHYQFSFLTSSFVSGEDAPLSPTEGARNEIYMSITQLEQAHLLWCYHALAQCEYKLGNIPDVREATKNNQTQNSYLFEGSNVDRRSPNRRTKRSLCAEKTSSR